MPLYLQIVVTGLGMLALGLWPPVAGRMLLVPIGSGDMGAVARIALASHAMLLGPGPLPGSLVVIGDRETIARHAGTSNVLFLAAPVVECTATAGAEDAA